MTSPLLAQALEHDDASSNRHHAPGFCHRGIFADNRFAISASCSGAHHAPEDSISFWPFD